MILCLSIVLIWSITILPILLSCFISILVGYLFELVINEEISIVRKCLFISSGEIMTHGLTKSEIY
jgi:uncharacterized membrane protein YraQ (UPF0718 family)